jgi:branched-chain amino acid transport system permease protein
MLQLLADGLIVGSVISLGAVGLTMTYALLGFANFSHGELLTWGAYLALSAVVGFTAMAGAAATPIGPFSFGWPLLAALVVAAVLTALLALALDALLFERLRLGGNMITLVIASFGVALALRNLLQFAYGTIPQYYSKELQIAWRVVPREWFGGLRITPDQLFVLGLACVTVIVLHWFLTRTTLGKAMRATAMNRELARVCGIDVRAVVRRVWIVGAVLATLAGVFAGLVVQVRPQLGFDLLLPLFAAAILGGIGSPWGAVLGGLILGLAESFSVLLIGAEYRAATAFVVIIAILLVRPTGLFGARA